MSGGLDGTVLEPERRRSRQATVDQRQATVDQRQATLDQRQRVAADPEKLEKGLAQLVLTIIELLRQLMERQALRRIDAGSLSPEEEERLGRTFLALAERMEELKEVFGLDADDLNLDLGPLGKLI